MTNQKRNASQVNLADFLDPQVLHVNPSLLDYFYTAQQKGVAEAKAGRSYGGGLPKWV